MRINTCSLQSFNHQGAHKSFKSGHEAFKGVQELMFNADEMQMEGDSLVYQRTVYTGVYMSRALTSPLVAPLRLKQIRI